MVCKAKPKKRYASGGPVDTKSKKAPPPSTNVRSKPVIDKKAEAAYQVRAKLREANKAMAQGLTDSVDQLEFDKDYQKARKDAGLPSTFRKGGRVKSKRGKC